MKKSNAECEVITDPVEISRLTFEDEAPSPVKPEIEELQEAALKADYHKWSV